MSWLTRMIRRSNESFDVEYRDAGAEVRAQMMADSMAEARRPREPIGPPLVLWRFDGANWDRWSVLGLTYDDVDEHHDVPGTLLDHVRDLDPPLAENDRFRLEDGAWIRLAPDEPDASERTPVEPEAPTVAEQLEAWRNRRR